MPTRLAPDLCFPYDVAGKDPAGAWGPITVAGASGAGIAEVER